MISMSVNEVKGLTYIAPLSQVRLVHLREWPRGVVQTARLQSSSGATRQRPPDSTNCQVHGTRVHCVGSIRCFSTLPATPVNERNAFVLLTQVINIQGDHSNINNLCKERSSVS